MNRKSRRPPSEQRGPRQQATRAGLQPQHDVPRNHALPAVASTIADLQHPKGYFENEFNVDSEPIKNYFKVTFGQAHSDKAARDCSHSLIPVKKVLSLQSCEPLLCAVTLIHKSVLKSKIAEWSRIQS